MNGEPEQLGENGAIRLHMPEIEKAARESNGFVLEIGPGQGTGSTYAIQQGLEQYFEPLHVSVDHQDYMTWKPDVDWWKLVIGDSRDPFTAQRVAIIMAKSLVNRYAGLIFIDTDHTPGQITKELELWNPFAGNETVWLFHDTYMNGIYNPMTDAIKEWAEENGWIYEDVSKESHGLGRMRKI